MKIETTGALSPSRSTPLPFLGSTFFRVPQSLRPGWPGNMCTWVENRFAAHQLRK